MISPVVKSSFAASRFARGKNPNSTVIGAITMTNNQKPQTGTVVQQNKAVFVLRMIGIHNQSRSFVRKNRFRLVKTHAVFPDVDCHF